MGLKKILRFSENSINLLGLLYVIIDGKIKYANAAKLFITLLRGQIPRKTRFWLFLCP